MKIISKDEKEIWVLLPSGEKTVISSDDKWIIDTFPNWTIAGSVSKYVVCSRQIKTEFSSVTERVYLHRLIVRPKKQENVDHKDRDRLNNRRSNLRICNGSQNNVNTSPRGKNKYKGVYYRGGKRKLTKPWQSWVSFIDCKSRTGEKRKYLGYYKTAEEAAKAYDKEAKKVWGEYAYINFPDE